MTDNTFLPATAQETAKSRTPLLVIGGLVAAIALGGGGYLLMSGGSSEDLNAGPIPRHHVVTAPKAPVKAVKQAKVSILPAKTKVQIGRDPFRALILPAAGGAGVPGTTTTAPTTPTTTTTTTTPTTSGSTTTTPVVTSHVMVLRRVYGSGSNRTAEFTIDGKSMLAKAGSVFGPSSELKLLGLTQNPKGLWVATVQVGDSDPFDAVQGQRMSVQ